MPKQNDKRTLAKRTLALTLWVVLLLPFWANAQQQMAPVQQNCLTVVQDPQTSGFASTLFEAQLQRADNRCFEQGNFRNHEVRVFFRVTRKTEQSVLSHLLYRVDFYDSSNNWLARQQVRRELNLPASQQGAAFTDFVSFSEPLTASAPARKVKISFAP